MTVEERNLLWTKIQAFSLEEEGAAVTFSHKLATLQNWSPAFTKRVTDEYRKFILLCCIAENGASPSKTVDEAWHLHLTYTKSYWVDFCKNTLGKEIHHHPSKGGSDENHKHEEWYKRTLQLYKSVFGMAPPTDIWPRPAEYSLIIDIPAFSTGNNVKKWVAALLALPFLFTGFIYNTLFPFHLTGPEFLLFYIFLGLAIIASYVIIQKGKEKQVQQIVEDNFPGDATVFQMAHFLYGKHKAVQTAIVDLIRRNLLMVNKDKSIFVFSDRYVPGDTEQNPLIVSLLKQQNGCKVNYEDIAANWYREEQFAHPSLKILDAFANRETSFLHGGIFYAMLVATGVIRIIQGTYNHRPVSLLFFEMLILTVLLYFFTSSLAANNLIFKKAETLFKENLLQNKGYKDQLVNDFIVKGTPAIIGFSEGFLLAAVFSAYAQIPHGINNTGSSCSGGGGSGGGSCGGGGCGGCGGGD